MASVTEYLERLQKLTQTNCEILQAINDSFFTKNNYLTANIDDKKYVIPSFISLENKINSLSENFNNLVYAPKTGEATFNFDGSSQTIELKGFNCTPNSLSLSAPEKFGVETNHIFKDFLTPSTYINFNISSIPNDLNKVVIKKIVAISDIMKGEYSGYLTEIDEKDNKKIIYKTSKTIPYEDLCKKLALYKKDIDYIEYDTIKSLPVRKTIGTGLYTIKSIDANEITSELYETYTLTLKEELKYKLFDNTIEKYLQPGDELVTYDDSAKMRIVDIRSNAKQIVVEVLNGDYVNLVADSQGLSSDVVSDLSKLKFYSSIDFTNDKNINVALEEDQYIAVFISPLNERMNIRAPWGTGVIIDTYKLKNDNDVNYNEYYKNNVNNIGDVLNELTSVSSNGITKYSIDEFNVFTKYKPQILTKDLTIYQINTHLNNSPTIQKIRNLYNQKVKYNSELNEVQKSIDNINTLLASISFDDTTNIRTVYEGQLVEHNKKRNEIVSSLNSITNEISMAANNSDVPIENAKYHIRGFYNNPTDDNIKPYVDHIHGIRVWYRYKNKDQETGNAHSIGDNNIFSDWNEMLINKRIRNPKYNENGYIYKYNENNGTINEPSYNQIDIPISQGETVDIKLQIIWDFGFPYIETLSDWSEVVNIEFPEYLKKKVQILDIITENNNDIETNRFNSILNNGGFTNHINDKLIDQDSTYYHQPEHIASGFYTNERRVIPLKDKLISINNDITLLRDEVFGYSANNLSVNIFMDNINTLISPNQTNTVYLLDGIDVVNLQLTNNSDHSVKLYPIFIGSRNNMITDPNYNSIQIINYNNNGIKEEQRLNQYLYFRNKDAWTKESLNYQQIFPFIKSDYQLCVDSDSKFDYLEIKPQDSIVIPMKIEGQTESEQIWATLENADEQKEEARNSDFWRGEDYDYRDWWVYTGNAGKNQDGEDIYMFYKKSWQETDVYKNAYHVTKNLNIGIEDSFDYKIVIDKAGDSEYYDKDLGPITDVKKISVNNGVFTNIVQFSLRTSLYTDPVSYEVKFTKTSDNMFSVIKQTQINIANNYNSISK